MAEEFSVLQQRLGTDGVISEVRVWSYTDQYNYLNELPASQEVEVDFRHGKSSNPYQLIVNDGWWRLTYRPDRLAGESLSTWGKRLAQEGLLDDPEIRWFYQRAVLSSIKLILRLFIR